MSSGAAFSSSAFVTSSRCRRGQCARTAGRPAAASRRPRGTAVRAQQAGGGLSGEGYVEFDQERDRPITPFEEFRGNASRGLTESGVGAGGRFLSSTTRHVHIFAGVIVDGEMDQSQLDSLTLDVDPDCEFNWNDDALQKVYTRFDDLVDQHAGAPLADYTMRLIGSDLEHLMRQLLRAGEITYNLNHRAINYSMGRPHVRATVIEVPQADGE